MLLVHNRYNLVLCVFADNATIFENNLIMQSGSVAWKCACVFVYQYVIISIDWLIDWLTKLDLYTQSEKECDKNITTSNFVCLQNLYAHGTIRQSQLKAHQQITKSAINDRTSDLNLL